VSEGGMDPLPHIRLHHSKQMNVWTLRLSLSAWSGVMYQVSRVVLQPPGASEA
jgi:hypothetical protein